MAINGYFKPSHQEPAPYVSGSVYLPRLGVGDQVDFLLDTGADATTLHPRDAGKLGVYAHSLGSASVSAKGIGGPMQYTPEYTLVSFFDRDAGDWRNFRMQVYIASPENEYEAGGLPSLLGRDVLNRCRCTLDAAENSVTLEPRSSSPSA